MNSTRPLVPSNLLTKLGSAMGQSILLVCRDWANTEAAYRLFSNDRVSEAERNIAVGRCGRIARSVEPRRISPLVSTAAPAYQSSLKQQHEQYGQNDEPETAAAITEMGSTYRE
jgi:hypothetical protein